MSDIKMNRAAEIQKMYAEDERAETAISSAASMAPAPKKSNSVHADFFPDLLLRVRHHLF